MPIYKLQPNNRKGIQNLLDEQKKHVKYMWVGLHKRRDSTFYDESGIKKCNRILSICIMTDDNTFYYIDKRILAVNLSGKLYEYFKKTIMTPFRYDSQTEIIFSKEITNREPIFFILDVIRSQQKFTINLKDPDSLYKRINKTLHLHENWNVFGLKKMKKMFQELRDMGYTTFVPEDIFLKNSLKSEGHKKLFMDSVIAMIYMFYRNNNRYNSKKKVVD